MKKVVKHSQTKQLTVALVVLGLILAIRLSNSGLSGVVVILLASCIVGLMGLVQPDRLGGVTRMWLMLGEVLHKLVSRVMRVLIFFVISLVGLAMKARNKKRVDCMLIKKDELGFDLTRWS